MGCGAKTNKSELVRLALSASGLVMDRWQVLPGRGVYCCRKVQCYQGTVRQRKRLTWALRYQDTAEAGGLIISPGLESEFAAMVMVG